MIQIELAQIKRNISNSNSISREERKHKEFKQRQPRGEETQGIQTTSAERKEKKNDLDEGESHVKNEL